MSDSTQQLRRAAKALRRAFEAGDPAAQARVTAVLPGAARLKHADALHVIAREAGHDSWPKLKFAAEAVAMDRAARAERLKMALYLGQPRVVEALLAETPDLGQDNFGLQCALYDRDGVAAQLARDPGAALREVGPRRPILHLAFSRHWQAGGDQGDMIAVAGMLLAHGADVDDSFAPDPETNYRLPALYGALGHAGNMTLARWLLEHGADPNDGESLFHSVELGHLDGLRMMLEFGARPEGTNALPRALDFDSAEAVRLLLEAGADPNEGITWPESSGEAPMVIPALHQAARRMCSPEIVGLLLDHGADPAATYQGHTAYAMARVHGNAEMARLLEARGGDQPLTEAEAQLARAAEDAVRPRDWIDMGRLSDEMRRLLTRLVWQEGTLPHMERLVAMGFDPNVTDEMGLTPLQLAGWEGVPDKMAFLLRQQPDLGHVNGYGGTLFSTILHGAENCPKRVDRDHIGCMRMALEQGIAIPRKALGAVGEAGMMAFLADWAEARPGQVVEDGVF
jgi:hypothetical protein